MLKRAWDGGVYGASCIRQPVLQLFEVDNADKYVDVVINFCYLVNGFLYRLLS